MGISAPVGLKIVEVLQTLLFDLSFLRAQKREIFCKILNVCFVIHYTYVNKKLVIRYELLLKQSIISRICSLSSSPRGIVPLGNATSATCDCYLLGKN